jgi:Flp pilus assembly protein TadD
LVRAGRHDEALGELSAAAALEPADERFVYVYGVALNSLGRIDEAIAILQTARQDFPSSYDIGWALATVLRDNGDREGAKIIATELLSDNQDDANLNALLESLQ